MCAVHIYSRHMVHTHTNIWQHLSIWPPKGCNKSDWGGELCGRTLVRSSGLLTGIGLVRVPTSFLSGPPLLGIQAEVRPHAGTG